MGHLNQSIAFAKHLEADYEIAPVHFSHKAYKLLSYLLDKCKIYTSKLFTLSTIEGKHFDLIVCAGSSTYYAAKTLSKRLKLHSVTMMLPQSYRYDFDVIFAQSHDHPPKQTNIITLPANFSYVEPKGLFNPKQKSLGIIIGGHNSHVKRNQESIKNQLDFIVKDCIGYEIAGTTSPRTPSGSEELTLSYLFT